MIHCKNISSALTYYKHFNPYDEEFARVMEEYHGLVEIKEQEKRQAEQDAAMYRQQIVRNQKLAK